MKKNKDCDHQTGFSAMDDDNTYGDICEGGNIWFFVQCDDCGQKMKVTARIDKIEESK